MPKALTGPAGPSCCNSSSAPTLPTWPHPVTSPFPTGGLADTCSLLSSLPGCSPVASQPLFFPTGLRSEGHPLCSYRLHSWMPVLTSLKSTPGANKRTSYLLHTAAMLLKSQKTERQQSMGGVALSCPAFHPQIPTCSCINAVSMSLFCHASPRTVLWFPSRTFGQARINPGTIWD